MSSAVFPKAVAAGNLAADGEGAAGDIDGRRTAGARKGEDVCAGDGQIMGGRCGVRESDVADGAGGVQVDGLGRADVRRETCGSISTGGDSSSAPVSNITPIERTGCGRQPGAVGTGHPLRIEDQRGVATVSATGGIGRAAAIRYRVPPGETEIGLVQVSAVGGQSQIDIMELGLRCGNRAAGVAISLIGDGVGDHQIATGAASVIRLGDGGHHRISAAIGRYCG